MLAHSKENYVSKWLNSFAHLQANLALVFVRRRYPGFQKMMTDIDASQPGFQPRISLEDGRITAAETRLYSDQMNGIEGPEMLKIAENMGILENLDRKRLDQICASIKEWDEKGIVIPCFSLDVPGLSLCRPGFPEMVCELLDQYDIDPGRLEIEVNEDAISVESAEKVLWKLSGVGIRLALDHFGRDQASLNLLRRFPFSTIKLDADLVDLAPHDEEEGTMVASIIEVAYAMNITVVALGVETDEHKSFLSEHGCFQVQGPMMGDDLSRDELFDLCRLLENVALAPGNVDIDRTDPECWASQTTEKIQQG